MITFTIYDFGIFAGVCFITMLVWRIQYNNKLKEAYDYITALQKLFKETTGEEVKIFPIDKSAKYNVEYINKKEEE